MRANGKDHHAPEEEEDVDPASFIVRRDLVGTTRWRLDRSGAAGPFVQELVAAHPEQHKYWHRLLGTSKALEWREGVYERLLKDKEL